MVREVGGAAGLVEDAGLVGGAGLVGAAGPAAEPPTRAEPAGFGEAETACGRRGGLMGRAVAMRRELG